MVSGQSLGDALVAITLLALLWLSWRLFPALHLLIPQLENSIRAILVNYGEIVSTLEDDGVQDERNLNSLLYSRECIT